MARIATKHRQLRSATKDAQKTCDIIRAQPPKVKDRDQRKPQPNEQEQTDPQSAQGTNAPQPVLAELVQLSSEVGQGQRAPRKGTVFDRSEAKLFIEALENPDHQYRQRAVQHVRRFNVDVEKEKVQDLINERGILIGQASRKYGIPVSTLRGWEAMGIISALHRGQTTQGVYYDEEVVARAAPVYHESKQQGVQAAGRLKALFAEQEEGQQQRKPKKKVVEPKLITLKGAEETYGVPYETLRSWYRSGHLPERGREVFGTHGGGKILVHEQDVIRLMNQPPTRGRPPNKHTE